MLLGSNETLYVSVNGVLVKITAIYTNRYAAHKHLLTNHDQAVATIIGNFILLADRSDLPIIEFTVPLARKNEKLYLVDYVNGLCLVYAEASIGACLKARNIHTFEIGPFMARVALESDVNVVLNTGGKIYE